MFLLAIDTSGKNGSLALARAGNLDDDHGDFEVLEIAPLVGGTFSAQLIPQIISLLDSQELTKFNIDALAVVSGPGSFTGLRVGLAAVKGLAEVLHKPIVPVSLLEACAYASGPTGNVLAALDAGRGEIYIGEYKMPASPGHTPTESLLGRDEFLSRIRNVTVVTPDSTLAEAATAAGAHMIALPPISAGTIAAFGYRKLRSGDTVTPDQLEANYIRRTDAEMLKRMGS